MTRAIPLTIDVFTAPARSLIRPPKPAPPPGGWTWPPTAAVLIAGKRDALVVDTLVTIADATKLADWIGATGKRLKWIYITHDHADHYLGAPVLLKRFPGARLVALPQVVRDIRRQFECGIVEKYWKPMFYDNVADGQFVPEPLADGHIELHGHDIIAMQTGQSDTLHSTYLHIPELSAIVAGDIAYNDVHMHMDNTTHAKRVEWIQTLCGIGALNPRTVIASHRRRGAADTGNVIAESIKYIDDFDRIVSDGVSAQKLIEAMKASHPGRLNLTTLYDSAYMLCS